MKRRYQTQRDRTTRQSVWVPWDLISDNPVEWESARWFSNRREPPKGMELVDEIALDGGVVWNRQAILAREQVQMGGQAMPSKKKSVGKGKKKKAAAPAKENEAAEKKSECPSYGSGHAPDSSDCQSCAVTYPGEFKRCKDLTAKKAAAEKKPKRKVKAKGGKKARAKKEPVPEETIKKALTLAAKAIKAGDGAALSGEQMDQIVEKVQYPGGRGPLRLLLRERGLHLGKGKRRTDEAKIDSKAIAKYL